MSSSTYSGENIQVLEGLDPVRKRPGMYIGGTGKAGLHHLLWEVVDNSVDEAINGFASSIEVILHADGKSCTVIDNGRGIPVDIHPVKKIPTLEVILTTLHAGGKFEPGSYITSGGLHGVGSSVVNALTTELVARIKRDGFVHEQRYSRGIPQTKLQKVESNIRGTGTSIFFRPDEEIFTTTTFDAELIAERLEMKTYLNSSLKIIFKDEVAGKKYEYHHKGGIAEYLDFLIKSTNTRRVHEETFAVIQAEMEENVRVEICLHWTEAPRELLKSFVNGIPTADGGTHIQGLKDGVVRAIRAYMETHGLIDKKLDISADDIREGLYGVVNLFMSEPQFQGQTKEKLNNPEIRSKVNGAFRIKLEQHLNKNPSTADAIATRVVQAAKARKASRAAVQQVRRKSNMSRRLTLPGKLADCSSSDPAESEIFIVEGDSAGGSAKQGRDRKTQAILPLRGKVLNAEQATPQKVSGNRELNDVIMALGCGVGDQLDPSKLRYHKVVLLMDADADGHHIATLLLTFIYRYMKPLIENGYIFLAQPPLFRVDVGKKTHWALDEAERDKIIKKENRKKRPAKIEIQRFKGLGEMMPATLRETTLDPDRRRLLQVTIPDTEKLVTENMISDLMGKEAVKRYNFIIENASIVSNLDV